MLPIKGDTILHMLNQLLSVFNDPATRWRRTGMRRDLPTKLYDEHAGIACDGPIPGASVRNCCAASVKIKLLV